jgi:hypothetical protein
MFVVLKPDKTPIETPFLDMASAQQAIAAVEPDVIEQGKYQIHPIRDPGDADRLKLKVIVDWKLEKFDGEFVGQPPVEVLEGTFDGTH